MRAILWLALVLLAVSPATVSAQDRMARPGPQPVLPGQPHGCAHCRRWHIRAILPAMLFGSQYYFNDYHAFGLYAPPLHHRWVRYGPDLVLVNVRNGHIRDVQNGASG